MPWTALYGASKAASTADLVVSKVEGPKAPAIPERACGRRHAGVSRHGPGVKPRNRDTEDVSDGKKR
jgi:hypothetical protein